jgi:hypothetical protein
MCFSRNFHTVHSFIRPDRVISNFDTTFSGSLPGTMVAHKLIHAIKMKCDPSEAEEILRELPNPLHSSAGLLLGLQSFRTVS